MENLDPTASAAIGGRVEELNRQSTNDIQNQYGSGMGQARGLISQPDNFGSQLSYGDRATSDAIRSRYNKGYEREERQLRLENLRNASNDKIRNLQVASSAAAQEVEMNKQKAILKERIEQANKRARGAVIGTVLGIVGGGAGLALGQGNPMAGMAGYAAGQGVGNMAGGM